MPGKRNDVEDSAADREIVLTRITSAWVLVLVILFGVTSPTPLTGNRSIRVSIESPGGGDASIPSEGECARSAEMMRASRAMTQEFDVPHTMVWEAWTDPKQFEMSMPAVSRHLKVLEKAGLIARGREAQWRPCKLKAEPLKQAADWLDEYRRFWEESFDRLDEYLKTLQEKEKGHARKKK